MIRLTGSRDSNAPRVQRSVREVQRAQILIDSENRSGDGHLLFALRYCTLSGESKAIKLTKER